MRSLEGSDEYDNHSIIQVASLIRLPTRLYDARYLALQRKRPKAQAAKKKLFKINLTQTTIPHQVLGHYGAGSVMLKPAPEGTGIIAGKTVRAVMTSAGVQNVLTKSLGSANPHNVVKATFDALIQLRNKDEVAALRGKSVEEL